MHFSHAPSAARSALFAIALIRGAISLAASPEAPFLAQNKAAMAKMMAAMDAKPSGDVDADFVAMMVPHHQGAIDTLTNTVIATVPIGQAAQAVNYVPDAVPHGDGMQGLQPLGVAGEVAHLTLAPPADAGATGEKAAPTSVSLFDQGCCRCCRLR